MSPIAGDGMRRNRAMLPRPTPASFFRAVVLPELSSPSISTRNSSLSFFRFLNRESKPYTSDICQGSKHALMVTQRLTHFELVSNLLESAVIANHDSANKVAVVPLCDYFFTIEYR